MLWRIVGQEIAEDRTLLFGSLRLHSSSLKAYCLRAERLGLGAQQLELYTGAARRDG
jgi:hypothetical protein